MANASHGILADNNPVIAHFIVNDISYALKLQKKKRAKSIVGRMLIADQNSHWMFAARCTYEL